MEDSRYNKSISVILAVIMAPFSVVSNDREYETGYAHENGQDVIEMHGVTKQSATSEAPYQAGWHTSKTQNKTRNTPVESVVDPCLEPGFDEAAKRLCPGWVVVCPEMAGLRGQHGFSDTDLRGGVSNRGAGNAANYQSCRPERVEVDVEPQVSLVDLIYEEWQQIQLPAPVITTQPQGGQTLVNMDTWVQAKQDPHITKVDLLGQTVLLRADPVLWHWDYGDDSEIVTNDHSGYEYPRMKGYHHYLKMGTYQLKATIEWVGQYAIPTGDGSPAQWHTIEGTAKTTATTPIKVGEHRPRLVHPN